MRRREVIAGLGGAALFRPFAAWPQQARPPRRIALVHSGIPAEKLTETGGTYWVRRFHEELCSLGHREGDTIAIARFSAQGDTTRYAALSAEIALSAPEVIISNSNSLVKSLIQAAPAIPVVGILGDPVGAGLVKTIARPGGSLTGVTVDGGPGIAGKRLQILRETVPGAGRIVHLLSSRAEELRAGPGIPRKVLADVSEAQLRRAFSELADDKTDALVVSEDGSYLAMRSLIVALAAQYRLPAIYAYRDFAEIGGLLAYGPELGDLAKRMANDVHLILNGTKPGDIPIYQPTVYELLVNLKTASALGLALPRALLAQADEVIE